MAGCPLVSSEVINSELNTSETPAEVSDSPLALALHLPRVGLVTLGSVAGCLDQY